MIFLYLYAFLTVAGLSLLIYQYWRLCDERRIYLTINAVNELQIIYKTKVVERKIKLAEDAKKANPAFIHNQRHTVDINQKNTNLLVPCSLIKPGAIH